MAFVSKIGNMLKQTISNRIKVELSTSNPSLYQAIRCMSSSKVFVGGLPFSTDEMSLGEAFAPYGEVVEARIVMDRDSGRSRGFGFVSYTSSEGAYSAIQALDGKDFQGRMLRVNYAVEKSRAGGYGGGYGYNTGSGIYGASGRYGSGGTSYTSSNGNYGGGGTGYGGNYGGTSSFDGGNSSGYGSSPAFGGGADNYFPSGRVASQSYGGGGGGSFDGGNTAGHNGGDSSRNFSLTGHAGGVDNYFSGSSGGVSGFADGGSDDMTEDSYKNGKDEGEDYASTRG